MARRLFFKRREPDIAFPPNYMRHLKGRIGQQIQELIRVSDKLPESMQSELDGVIETYVDGQRRLEAIAKAIEEGISNCIYEVKGVA